MRMDQLVETLLGPKLGEGSFRKVYECNINDKYVVKVEMRAPFSNIAEWELWQAAKRLRKGKWAKWLAPCFELSYAGHVLIQERAQPLETLPDKVPDFLCDVKPANWGLIDGRPVCIDYGWHHGQANILLHGKLCKPSDPRLGPGIHTQRWGHPQVDGRGKTLEGRRRAGSAIIGAPILPSVHES